MKLEFEDFKIKTDSDQFIVEGKREIKKTHFTKEDNIGGFKWVEIAYFPSLDFALKFICRKTLLDNDDLSIIKEKLTNIEAKMNEFLKELKQPYGEAKI